MSDPISIILCGKIPPIATAVKASLQPEYEVIHIILSVEAGVSEIPALLRGENPPSGDEKNLGTRNYSKPPAAVVSGGGYDDATVTEMRDACKGESNVPWLRLDVSALPPHGPRFGAAMAEKVKDRLGELVKDGKMNQDGVYFY